MHILANGCHIGGIRRKEMKHRDILALLAMIVATIGLIVMAVWGFALRVQNPDMTDMRFMLEFPGFTVGTIVCFVLYYFGREQL